MSLMIRREKENEHREVENLVRESFWNVYRPGCMEHFVLHELRNDAAFVPELDLVLLLGEEKKSEKVQEKEGKRIGQVMFMRAEISADDGRKIPVMTMGPICVIPEFQGKGYGKALLDEALKRAEALGCGAVLLEGNPDFYGKSGFVQANTLGIRYHGMEEGEETPFFLCKELIPGYLDGITGEYAAPAGYYVDEAETERFDQEFPYKEKKKLPGQLFADEKE